MRANEGTITIHFTNALIRDGCKPDRVRGSRLLYQWDGGSGGCRRLGDRRSHGYSYSKGPNRELLLLQTKDRRTTSMLHQHPRSWLRISTKVDPRRRIRKVLPLRTKRP